MLALLLLAPVLGSCHALGNLAIGHHPDSMATAGFSELQACRSEQGALVCGPEAAALGGGATALLAEAVPIVIGLVQEGVAVESRRYSATYSSRIPVLLYQCRARKPDARIQALRFLRRDPEGRELLRLDVAIRLTDDASALYLEPLAFRVSRTRSKVAFASWWPWHWPASLVWALWFAADRDIAMVDFNAQVRVDAIAEQKQQRVVFTVGTADIPLGRKAIWKLAEETSLAGAPRSAWMPLPKLDCAKNGAALPATFTVTVMEANDLGDVIARGAAKFGEKQDEIAARIQQQLE